MGVNMKRPRAMINTHMEKEIEKRLSLKNLTSKRRFYKMFGIKHPVEYAYEDYSHIFCKICGNSFNKHCCSKLGYVTVCPTIKNYTKISQLNKPKLLY